MGQASRRSPTDTGRFLRGRPATRRFPRTAVIIGCLVAAMAVGSALLGEHSIRSLLKLRVERRGLETEVEDLRSREKSLAADIDALDSDPEVLERVARERYRMHKPGETVIEVIGGPSEEPKDKPPASP